MSEIRWFVAGRLPLVPCLAEVEADERTDLYHVPSLSATTALKRRGGAALELKRRTRPPEAVEYLGRSVVAEHWAKRRLAVGGSHGSDAAWAPVGKRVWRMPGFQVAELTLAGAPWWTIAVRRQRRGFPDVPRPLRPLVETAAQRPCRSYAAWLLERSATFDAAG